MTFVPPTSKASVIVTAAKARTRQGVVSPSSAYGETELYRALNDINEWFCYWTFEPEQGGMQPFSFLRREHIFSSVAGTTLNGAISAAANSLVLDSAAGFTETVSAGSPGGLWIKNDDYHFDFVTFEQRTTVTCTDLATVDINHTDDSDIEKIYLVPTDYGRPRTIKISEPYHLQWLDAEYEGVPPPGYFHVRFLPTKTLAPQNSGKQFIVLPEDLNENTLTLYYVKKPNEITNGDSYTDAPNGIARWAMIYKLMEYIWETRGEEQRAQRFAKLADEKMRHFASSQVTVDISPYQGPTYDYDEI